MSDAKVIVDKLWRYCSILREAALTEFSALAESLEGIGVDVEAEP